jgi:hypothetical protein
VLGGDGEPNGTQMSLQVPSKGIRDLRHSGQALMALMEILKPQGDWEWCHCEPQVLSLWCGNLLVEGIAAVTIQGLRN